MATDMLLGSFYKHRGNELLERGSIAALAKSVVLLQHGQLCNRKGDDEGQNCLFRIKIITIVLNA